MLLHLFVLDHNVHNMWIEIYILIILIINNKIYVIKF